MSLCELEPATLAMHAQTADANMSNDSNNAIDYKALQEQYENTLWKVVRMRKTYPSKCASYLSIALKSDADMMMKAEVVLNEKVNNTYSSKYLDNAKLEELHLNTTSEPLTSKVAEISEQFSDLQDVLNYIRAKKHKNVQL